MLNNLLLLIPGLALLVAGGDLLVRGAVRIAERLRLSPMLIGLTIVGMGTSMPELAASVQAALAGSPGIAVGNIVGSNIANLLLILGIAALLAPIAVARGPLWRDGSVGVAAAAALLAAGATVGLGREAGLLFVAALAAYVYYAYRQEQAGAPHSAAFDKALAAEAVHAGLAAHTPNAPGAPAAGSLLPPLAFFLSGLALVVGGGVLVVEGAIGIAAALGVSDTVIGLTVVAVGTSLPELVTSAVAALKRQGEIALGNVLGSNIYNIFFIGGVTGLVSPGPVPEAILGFDLWLLLAASLMVMAFARTGGRLSRREGALLVGGYALYVAVTAGWV